MKKRRLLLLDTDVIVFAHQFGVWDKLKDAYEVHVPATVIDKEAKFFDSSSGRIKIDLRAEETSGKIHRAEATATEVTQTFSNFEATFLAALDDGEKEGIAILRAEAGSGLVFCTGDMIGIESVAMLGLSQSCMSFEEVLHASGLLKLVAKFPRALSKDAHDTHLEKGKTRRITGECFKNSPLLENQSTC